MTSHETIVSIMVHDFHVYSACCNGISLCMYCIVARNCKKIDNSLPENLLLYSGYCVKAGWQAHSSSMLLLFLVLCMFLFLCCSCVHVTLSFVFIYPWANAEVNVMSSMDLPVTSIQYRHGGILFLDSYSYLLCCQWTDESIFNLCDFIQ